MELLDRHVARGLAERTAIVHESETGAVTTISYGELLAITKNIAASLDEHGIRAGDRVVIYMPLTPHGVAAMLACARIGAVHTVVFGGFSKEALVERIHDSQAKAVITATASVRKGQQLLLGKTVQEAVNDERSKSVTCVMCFGDVLDNKFTGYQEYSSWPAHIHQPQGFSAEHPLLFSTLRARRANRRGFLYHGRLSHQKIIATTKWVFDPTPRDLYWCTADIGWITGHSYVVYGPLALGSSIFLYDGALNFPDSSRVYQLINRHKISILYTAPQPFACSCRRVKRPSAITIYHRYAYSVRWVSLSIRKRGRGIGACLAKINAPSSILGGKPKRAP